MGGVHGTSSSSASFLGGKIKTPLVILWGVNRLLVPPVKQAFDADDNGLLSASEVYGALRFLGMPALTPGAFHHQCPPQRYALKNH